LSDGLIMLQKNVSIGNLSTIINVYPTLA